MRVKYFIINVLLQNIFHITNEQKYDRYEQNRCFKIFLEYVEYFLEIGNKNYGILICLKVFNLYKWEAQITVSLQVHC